MNKIKRRQRLRQEELDITDEMMRAITVHFTLDDVFRTLMNEIRHHLKFERVGLFLVSTKDKKLEERIGTDAKGNIEVVEGKGIPLKKSSGPMARMVLEKKKSFIAKNYHRDPRIKHDCWEARMQDTHVKEVALISIFFLDEIVAVISLDNLISGKHLSAKDITLLEEYRDQIGIAVKHALVYNELEQANKELERLSKIKSNFISMVSHELRTPLMVVKETISQVLGGIKGEITEEQREFLSVGEENLERLGKMIDELLDISHIETGRIKLNKKRTNLITLIRKALTSFQPAAEENKIELQATLPSQSLFVVIDEERIYEVIANLLDNALKFTPEKGKINLNLQDKQEVVEISVIDTGIGIPAKYTSKIFERFERVDLTPIPGRGGTGLGLSIAREFVQMHGGNIWVESKLKKGSKFTFTLPKRSAYPNGHRLRVRSAYPNGHRLRVKENRDG